MLTMEWILYFLMRRQKHLVNANFLGGYLDIEITDDNTEKRQIILTLSQEMAYLDLL